jgi:hypothetical protein
MGNLLCISDVDRERARLQNEKILASNSCAPLHDMVEELSVLENATTLEELHHIEMLLNWWNRVGKSIHRTNYIAWTQGIYCFCAKDGCRDIIPKPEIKFYNNGIPLAPGLPLCENHSPIGVPLHFQQILAAVLVGTNSWFTAHFQCTYCGQMSCEDSMSKNDYVRRIHSVQLAIECKDQKDMMDVIFTLPQPVAEEIAYYLGYGVESDLFDGVYEDFYNECDAVYCHKCHDGLLRPSNKYFWDAIE